MESTTTNNWLLQCEDENNKEYNYCLNDPACTALCEYLPQIESEAREKKLYNNVHYNVINITHDHLKDIKSKPADIQNLLSFIEDTEKYEGKITKGMVKFANYACLSPDYTEKLNTRYMINNVNKLRSISTASKTWFKCYNNCLNVFKDIYCKEYKNQILDALKKSGTFDWLYDNMYSSGLWKKLEQLVYSHKNKSDPKLIDSYPIIETMYKQWQTSCAYAFLYHALVDHLISFKDKIPSSKGLSLVENILNRAQFKNIAVGTESWHDIWLVNYLSGFTSNKNYNNIYFNFADGSSFHSHLPVLALKTEYFCGDMFRGVSINNTDLQTLRSVDIDSMARHVQGMPLNLRDNPLLKFNLDKKIGGLSHSVRIFIVNCPNLKNEDISIKFMKKKKGCTNVFLSNDGIFYHNLKCLNSLLLFSLVAISVGLIGKKWAEHHHMSVSLQQETFLAELSSTVRSSNIPHIYQVIKDKPYLFDLYSNHPLWQAVPTCLGNEMPLSQIATPSMLAEALHHAVSIMKASINKWPEYCSIWDQHHIAAGLIWIIGALSTLCHYYIQEAPSLTIIYDC